MEDSPFILSEDSDAVMSLLLGSILGSLCKRCTNENCHNKKIFGSQSSSGISNDNPVLEEEIFVVGKENIVVKPIQRKVQSIWEGPVNFYNLPLVISQTSVVRRKFIVEPLKVKFSEEILFCETKSRRFPEDIIINIHLRHLNSGGSSLLDEKTLLYMMTITKNGETIIQCIHKQIIHLIYEIIKGQYLFGSSCH